MHAKLILFFSSSVNLLLFVYLYMNNNEVCNEKNLCHYVLVYICYVMFVYTYVLLFIYNQHVFRAGEYLEIIV